MSRFWGTTPRMGAASSRVWCTVPKSCTSSAQGLGGTMPRIQGCADQDLGCDTSNRELQCPGSRGSRLRPRRRRGAEPIDTSCGGSGSAWP